MEIINIGTYHIYYYILKAFFVVLDLRLNPTQTGGGQRARGCILCFVFRKLFARLALNVLTFPKYYIGSISQKKIHITTCHEVTAFLCHDVIKKIPPF